MAFLKALSKAGRIATLRAPAGASELELGNLFLDHAGMQRDPLIMIRGWAEEGAEAAIEFAGQRKIAAVCKDGKWTVTLDPMPASSEDRKLRVQISGHRSRRIRVRGSTPRKRKMEPFSFLPPNPADPGSIDAILTQEGKGVLVNVPRLRRLEVCRPKETKLKQICAARLGRHGGVNSRKSEVSQLETVLVHKIHGHHLPFRSRKNPFFNNGVLRHHPVSRVSPVGGRSIRPVPMTDQRLHLGELLISCQMTGFLPERGGGDAGPEEADRQERHNQEEWRVHPPCG